MVQTSFQNITPLGITIGSAGLSNFSQVFKNPNLPGILVRTVIWVAASVAITMVISLGLAQLYNQRFPGRRFARWAIIAPWAASVMMTALIFRWVLQPENGVVNVFLHQLGLVRFNSNQADWLGRPDSALVWMIGVAVFVSLPFTTYVLLAGLQSIPGELFEAARVDGASSWRAYRRITLPLLRPAFLVALVINLMNVFNSFPIIWEMTRGGPGYETSTTTVFMYDLKGTFVGQAAAMSIVNFGLVVIIVLVFLRLNRWNRQEAA
jgi:multiple sugar transport system permease protein